MEENLDGPNFTVVGGMNSRKINEIPPVLPVLPVEDMVVFPMTITPLIITDPYVIKLINEASMGDRLLGIFTVKEKGVNRTLENFCSQGTLGFIHRLISGQDNVSHLIIQSHFRLSLDEIVAHEPFIRARISRSRETPMSEDDLEGEALVRNLRQLLTRYISTTARLPEEQARRISEISDARQLTYTVASALSVDTSTAYTILEADTVKEKVKKVTELMHRELEVLDLGQKIRNQAQSEIEKTNREYILRQQLRAIHEELGEGDGGQNGIQETKKKIEQIKMPEEAKNEALRELKRLEKLTPQSAEYPILESYLEWLTELPWDKRSEDNLEINGARNILDEDHYGLKDVKERILEYLAVRKLREERKIGEANQEKPTLRPERQGAIICFVGPPGVGKTSLGMSIARSLNRKFIRMSLGGVRDEAEIRGHRRTYIGAVPGRIIQSVRRVGTKNPVFMLDEIDKVGADWRGDPSSALLEVLDPEQNREFRDNYLNVPFDLSQVLFIATANVTETIPPALLDRMEIITLAGYTDVEKRHIAERYLVPRQLLENGLHKKDASFDSEAILTIIQDYTREAGVRDLERQIGRICRKIAMQLTQGKDLRTINKEEVHYLLGKPRFYHEASERTDVPGVAIALAVTPVGGDILFIEATRMHGSKGFNITGQLGDVMKESAQAAYSIVRSKAQELGIDEQIFEKSDVHIHVPAGAVPKDGPSAGIAMATAISSLFTQRPVRPDVGMTGEITLRGKVLPVGGIKEKAIAGHRAGLKTILIPKHNNRDLDDLPDNVRDELDFILIERVDEAFNRALEEASKVVPEHDGRPSTVDQQEPMHG